MGNVIKIINAASTVVNTTSTVVNAISRSYKAYNNAANPHADLPKDRKNVKSYMKKHENKLADARDILEILKTGLTMLKDRNERLSGKVDAVLVSLEYLGQNLTQNRYDGGNPREVKKIEEIYSNLKTAWSSIRSTIDSNNSSSATLSHTIKLTLQRWITTPQTKEQLEEIETKIKDAVQKSIELTTISTSVAVTKLRILQHFNTNSTWLVTNNTSPPNPPQLCVKEITNKFILTWSRKDGDDVDFF